MQKEEGATTKSKASDRSPIISLSKLTSGSGGDNKIATCESSSSSRTSVLDNTSSSYTKTRSTEKDPSPSSPKKLTVGRTLLPRGHSLHLNASSSASGNSSILKTTSMTSSLLSKLDSFLPQMAAANKTLAESMAQDPEKNVAVDYVSDEEKPHIQMEIAMVPDAETMASVPEELLDASRHTMGVDSVTTTSSAISSAASSTAGKESEPKKESTRGSLIEEM